jgi:hypothetical protein
MTNEEREAQRELFESNAKGLFLDRDKGEYVGFDAQIAFKYWLLSVESQPKREIRLPEPLEFKCMPEGLEFIGYKETIRELKRQGLKVYEN